MNVCTIVAKNYLAHARVLARSLREQHPDSRLSVLVLDETEGYVDPASEPYRLLRPHDIDCEPFDEMVAAYSVIELSTAVKPWLLRKLLAEDDHAVYLDPDIQVTASLDEVRELAVRHGIVLTPHNTVPIPRDGRYPSEESILIAGAYNLGFIALGDQPCAHELLDWWAERLATDCVVDPASGRFVDQKWIDLVPGIWPQTHLLRDPAYNIAYWNLHARRLERGAGDRIEIEGRPARFLHFSGYSPDRPEELSKHQDRIRFDERPDVREACDAYGKLLVEQGYPEVSRWPYGFASQLVTHDGGRVSEALAGVNVVGYLNAELGVGEVARQAIGALDTQGIPVVPVGISTGITREDHVFEHAGRPASPFGLNLLCVNADMLPTVAGELGPGFFEGRRSVGWWWWEAEDFPEQWRESFGLVDEVWAGSRFVADALARVSPVPVTRIPTPVTMRPGVTADREAVGLPDGFVFLFVFDFNSVVARKNPLGLIEAFKRAFPEPGDEVSLVLKTINGERHPDALAAVQAATAGRPDVLVRDEFLDASLRDVLIASCDCYVSLHRSEGFGITLAEAMLLEKPVIGTGYSGTTDFLSDATGFVVGHELVPIGPGADPYPAGSRWAEPDLDHAATLMRRVIDDPAEAAARAQRGRSFILEHHSPAAAGRAMAQRLAAMQPATSLDVLDPPAAEEAQQARTDTLSIIHRPPAAPVSAAGRGVDRVTNRLLRRHVVHQREVDQALWWSIESQARATLMAIEEHGERLERAEAAIRQSGRALQALSQHDVMIGDLARSQDRAQDHLRSIEERVQRLMELRDAAHAEPYMQGEPFRRLDVEGAGRVLGYEGHGATTTEDGQYHAFEDVFRGSEEMIRERQARYVPMLREQAPVLDAGCGRGELLDVLRDAGIAARGVDLDPELVAYCRDKGHDAGEADAVRALEAADPGSLGAVCAMQVVEHLPEDELRRMIAAAHRALRPGGLLVLETVNPHSPWALKAFWVDLTHQHPIFPEVLLQLVRQAGFGDGYAFAPNGDGDWDRDRDRAGEYAVVARR